MVESNVNLCYKECVYFVSLFGKSSSHLDMVLLQRQDFRPQQHRTSISHVDSAETLYFSHGKIVKKCCTEKMWFCVLSFLLCPYVRISAWQRSPQLQIRCLEHSAERAVKLRASTVSGAMQNTGHSKKSLCLGDVHRSPTSRSPEAFL